MFRLLMKFYWKLSGWKIVGQFPHHYKKMILAVAPLTSWKDILIGFAVRSELRIEHANFLGKKELFEGTFGFVFRKLGGIPVDRFGQKSANQQGVVEQAVSLFANNENFILGLAPEGTRKRVNKLRSGFYQIAKKAQVPIVPFGLDFEHKQILIGEPLFTSLDEEEDFKKIIAFFSSIKGKEPTFDLRHLQVAEID
jgi:1-acyl-sn-glycerol-3-phosphate acyltransferase